MDPAKGDNLIAFLNDALSTDGQGKAASLGYAPLPEKQRTASLAAVGKINATAAQAAPVPAPPAASPAPTATTAPKPAPAPEPAAAAAPAPSAPAAPDPAIASTGSSSAATAALAGFLLAVGGLCVAMGRKRRAVRA